MFRFKNVSQRKEDLKEENVVDDVKKDFFEFEIVK